MRENTVLSQFKGFYRNTQGLPPITKRTQEEAWVSQGLAIEKLLRGGTKEQFLMNLEKISRGISTTHRLFFLLHPESLEACLRWFTEDPHYAAEMRQHELQHARLFLNFVPRDKRDRAAEVAFAIFVGSGFVTPYTHACRRIFPYAMWPFSRWEGGLLRSVERNSNALLESWHVGTIRQFYQYLREQVRDGSGGDRSILRN